jgi:hypothetical protein
MRDASGTRTRRGPEAPHAEPRGELADGHARVAETLRTPLRATAVYTLAVGLTALSPSLVRILFGYEVKDGGVLLVLSASYLVFGVVLWSIAGDPQKYGGLAPTVSLSLVIGIVFLSWGWARGLFTPRNIAAPLAVDAVLAAWIWLARGGSHGTAQGAPAGGKNGMGR